MPKIWRVENNIGKGCYIDNDYYYECKLEIHNGCKNHPSPSFDNGIDRSIKEEEICGFISKEQALNWFTKFELKKLELYGYNLVEVDVYQITAIGEKQCLAIRNTPFEERKYVSQYAEEYMEII